MNLITIKSPQNHQIIIKFWKIKNWIVRADNHHQEISYQLNHSVDELKNLITNKKDLSIWLIQQLYQMAQAQNYQTTNSQTQAQNQSNDIWSVDFSLGALQNTFTRPTQSILVLIS